MDGAKIHVDRTASQLDDLIDEIGSDLTTPLQIAGDPLQGLDLEQSRLGQGGTIHAGRIHYTLPYLGWYRVALDDGHGVLPCCALEPASSILLGPRSTSLYPPGTGVLVQLFRQPVGLYGVILGAIPDLIDDANIIMPDWISQGSNVGTKREGYYLNYVEQLGDEGGAIDFSNSKPIDQLCFDWGIMAETGVGVHVDSYMAYLRVDEVCGVWFHYHDQHTVLAGISMDVFTASAYEQYRDDEGELTSFRGESPYPWEMLGTFTAGEENFKEVSDEDVHFEKPEAKYEPTKPDPQAFHRVEHYGGYLGQGGIRQVVVPPDGVGEGDVFALSTTDAPIGVFRESIGLDGSYSLASAKSVVIAKRALIPVPKRRKLAEDSSEDADSAENKNYKAAGQFGEGDDHVVGDLEVSGSNALLLTSAAVLDMHSYVFNWKTMHPFHYHKKDFITPEEGTSGKLEKVTAPLDLQSLQSNMWMSRAEPKKLKVDHRYDEVDYFELLSHITFTDDGGMILQGGHGEEVKFLAGNVVISCPGNVMFQPGKSIIGLAGDDYIIRARNSIDLTSSDKDIRLKAERNMLMLSGNGGVGGTLIENRAQGIDQDYPSEGGEKIAGTGVIFKAPNSIVGTMASEIYLRTGSDGIGEGPIVLDAAKGDADVRIIAGNIKRYVQGQNTTTFLSGTNKVHSVSSENQNEMLVGGVLNVNGSLKVNGNIQGKGPLQLTDGHVDTVKGGEVGLLRDVGPLRERVKGQTSEAENEQKTSALADHQSFVRERYYKDKQIGGKTTQKQVSFGLRDEKEYCTEEFKLPQTHWQVLEQQGGGGIVWGEKDVKYQDQFPRQPWPGKKAWEGDSNFLTLPEAAMQMYDVEQGKSKDRGGDDSPYEEPKFGEFTPKSAKASYKILDC